MKDIESYLNLMNILGRAVPEGTDEELEIDNIKVHFQKKDGKIKIEVKSDTTFDDSDIKELVEEYKESIKELDDDLFLEVTEELGKKISIKEFDELLNLEHFTEDQADKVEEMIDLASEIICSHLQCKIQELIALYNRF